MMTIIPIATIDIPCQFDEADDPEIVESLYVQRIADILAEELFD